MAVQNVLRIAAVLISCAAIAESIYLEQLFVAPFAVVGLLLILSFTLPTHPRPSILLALGLSVFIPVGAIAGYLHGRVILAVPIFDSLVFGWVLFHVHRAFRAQGEDHAGVSP